MSDDDGVVQVDQVLGDTDQNVTFELVRLEQLSDPIHEELLRLQMVQQEKLLLHEFLCIDAFGLVIAERHVEDQVQLHQFVQVLYQVGVKYSLVRCRKHFVN